MPRTKAITKKKTHKDLYMSYSTYTHQKLCETPPSRIEGSLRPRTNGRKCFVSDPRTFFFIDARYLRVYKKKVRQLFVPSTQYILHISSYIVIICLCFQSNVETECWPTYLISLGKNKNQNPGHLQSYSNMFCLHCEVGRY